MLRWQSLVDFLVLAAVFYALLRWARSTRALRIALAVVGAHVLALLARRLDLDCARMTVSAGLFEVLRVIRAEAMVVIATDNMDCFARAFEHARSRRRPGRDRETLADWAVICDDIICSSQAGALESEDPQAFFGPWLAIHGISFTDAVLIDDRADNCTAFTSQGGTAIQWKMGTSQATRCLRQWLDEDPRHRRRSRGACRVTMGRDG